MMADCYVSDPRVTRGGAEGYWVEISHGKYLVEFDDRDGLWWAHSNGARLRPLLSDHPGAYPATDPLACSSDACSGRGTAEELIAVLLSFDGQAVPA